MIIMFHFFLFHYCCITRIAPARVLCMVIVSFTCSIFLPSQNLKIQSKEAELVHLIRELARTCEETGLSVPYLDKPANGNFLSHLGKMHYDVRC